MSLREERIRAGLSQKDLAEAIGVGQSTIAGYENGSIGITDKRRRQLASLLNCDQASIHQSFSGAVKRPEDLRDWQRSAVGLEMSPQHRLVVFELANAFDETHWLSVLFPDEVLDRTGIEIGRLYDLLDDLEAMMLIGQYKQQPFVYELLLNFEEGD